MASLKLFEIQKARTWTNLAVERDRIAWSLTKKDSICKQTLCYKLLQTVLWQYLSRWWRNEKDSEKDSALWQQTYSNHRRSAKVWNPNFGSHKVSQCDHHSLQIKTFGCLFVCLAITALNVVRLKQCEGSVRRSLHAAKCMKIVAAEAEWKL